MQIHDDSPQKKYTILVGVDLSDVSTLALNEAIQLAYTHEPSEIHVVHSVPGMPPLGPATIGSDPTTSAAVPSAVPLDQLSIDMTREIQTRVEKALTQAAQHASSGQNQNSIHWTIHVNMLDPTYAIAQLASDIEADLVIVGTHSRVGLARFLLGSVAEGVVRRAPCPVLVVRPSGAQTALDSPRIEPPCPQCLETRKASGGAQFWCERHREHHSRAHTYHFTPFRDSHQSGLLLHPLD
ncbi:MAG TPA: universal stress protein [Polyangiaceae bacterium]|jgi:nucleotide-binding universal stress UspA family protein|nr:universal stress protein [Polyangiaceae bacterium]